MRSWKRSLVARAAVELHGVEGVDRRPEGREQPRRQPGPLVDRPQAQRPRVMDHQPGAVVRHAGQLGHAPLEEGHVAVGQGAQQQRGASAALRCAGGRRSPSRRRRGRPGRPGRRWPARRRRWRSPAPSPAMTAWWLIRWSRTWSLTMVDQPLGHRQRQDLAIGHRRQHPLGVLEPVDDLLQAALGEVGVVVGAGGSHGALAAVLGDGVGDGFGRARAAWRWPPGAPGRPGGRSRPGRRR